MTTLTIKNLVKKYGNNTVVDHLDLFVEDGEFVTLLGPSGCGKTTTLRAIAGLVEIDGGEIYFGDKLMNDVPPHKRSASMVFQTYALFPHMSVQDNIGFGLRMQQVPKGERERRVKEVLEMMGLSDLADRRPGQLSGGQQQRVAVARAIVTQPLLLLFDEPLSNLDLKLRERLRIDIRELQRRLKITSIYVTHDQAEALVISDRIAIMDQGIIVQIGDPVSVYTHPNSAFTADFIGQANTIKGKVISTNNKGCVIETPFGKLASSDNSNVMGAEVLACWRPEDMSFYKEGLENKLESSVIRNIFMGNLTEIFVDVMGNTFRLQIGGAVDLKPGDTVTLGVSKENIRAIGGSP
jgi:iron(III) transport system ATP-binding protein